MSKIIQSLLTFLLCAGLLSACGGGGSDSKPDPAPIVQTPAPKVTLSYTQASCVAQSACTVVATIPSGVSAVTVVTSDNATINLKQNDSDVSGTSVTDTSATFSVAAGSASIEVTFQNAGSYAVDITDYIHNGNSENQSGENAVTVTVDQQTVREYSMNLFEFNEYKANYAVTGYWLLLRDHVQIASIEAYLNDVDSSDCRIDNSSEKNILEFEISNFANCYNYGGENKVHLKVSHNGTSDLALEDVLEVQDYFVYYDTLAIAIYIDAKGVLFGVSDSANSNALLNALSLTNFYVNVKSDTSLPSGNYTVKIVYQPETDNITLLEEGITYQESSENNVMQLSGIPDLGYGISNLRELSMVVTDSNGTDFQLEFVSADVLYAYNGVTTNVNKANLVEKLKFVAN